VVSGEILTFARVRESKDFPGKSPISMEGRKVREIVGTGLVPVRIIRADSHQGCPYIRVQDGLFRHYNAIRTTPQKGPFGLLFSYLHARRKICLNIKS
jgi:hypothetical protein